MQLARWADEIVVAPATAEFIARLRHGLVTICSRRFVLQRPHASRSRPR
jgi:phosphopantothenoylcysteine synthetase/decarboxylase